MGKTAEDKWTQVISNGVGDDSERPISDDLHIPTLEEMQGEGWQAPPPVDGWKEVVYPVESGSDP